MTKRLSLSRASSQVLPGSISFAIINRHPKFRRIRDFRSDKTCRRDADDRERMGVEQNRLADDGRIAVRIVFASRRNSGSQPDANPASDLLPGETRDPSTGFTPRTSK